jgi:hypothetical protein
MCGTVPPVFLHIDGEVLNYIECEDNFLFMLRLLIPPTEQNVIMNHLIYNKSHINSLRINLICPSDNYKNNCVCTVLDDETT